MKHEASRLDVADAYDCCLGNSHSKASQMYISWRATMNLMRVRYAQKVIERALSEVELENTPVAWRLLEEAHVFSQPFSGLHFYVHWEMLSLAFHEKDPRKIRGQILHLLLLVRDFMLRRGRLCSSKCWGVGMSQVGPVSKHILIKLKKLEVSEKRRIQRGGLLEKYQRKFPLSRG